MRRRAGGLVLVLVLAGVAVRCTPPGGNGAEAPATSVVVPGPPAGPAYNSVADLARTLSDRGLSCLLDSPGQHDDDYAAETATCRLEGEEAQLQVWGRGDDLGRYLASPEARAGTVVVGANWAVTLTTDLRAQAVAAALGGMVAATGTARAGP